MPNYQLLFENPNILLDCIKLIYSQLKNDNAETGILQEFIEFVKLFFGLKISDNYLEIKPFSSNDLELLVYENFLMTRLQNEKKSLEEIIEILYENQEDSKNNSENEKNDENDLENKRKNKALKIARKRKAEQENISQKMIEKIKEISGKNDFLSELNEQISIYSENTENSSKFLPSYNNTGITNLLYSGQYFYSFFRHIHCLYERLRAAYFLIENCFEQEIETNVEAKTKFADLIKENKRKFINERYEQIFLPTIITYLQGEIDMESYEDVCKWLLGPRAYLLYTADKLISSVFFDWKNSIKTR